MFTGLIEAIGEVQEVTPTPAGFRLRLTTAIAPNLVAGDSLAVNGVCLTAVSSDASGIHADISPETLRVTALGLLRRGALVNLERPLRADARLGGHFVQGHVDATGTIDDIRMLKAICSHLGNRECRDRASALLKKKLEQQP